MSDTYRHGIYTQELDTAITPMISVASPLVAVGTAPFHLAKNPAPSNTPVLCHTLAEFVEQFGWSEKWSQFTLCEVAYTAFQLYNTAPVIFINVLGGDTHLKGVASSVVTAAGSPYTLAIEASTNHVWMTGGETASYTIDMSTNGWAVGAPLPATFYARDAEAITLAVAGSGANQVWLSGSDYTVYFGIAAATDAEIQAGALDSWGDSTPQEEGDIPATKRCWRVKLTTSGAAKMASAAEKTLKLGKATLLTAGKDYTVGHDSDGRIVVTLLKTTETTPLTIWYEELSTDKVRNADVIGGYDSASGKNKGLECIEEIYPRFGVLPGALIVPYWSQASAVSAIMKAKTENINGCFKSIAIADISCYGAPKYTAVNAYKNDNNLVDGHLIVCWPRVSLGGRTYFMSTHLGALLGKVDSEHDDLPYKSPSNESLQIDSTVLHDGSEYFLGKSQANYLNGIGVVTALNFVGGWRAWGNRTSLYPSSGDPKDAFIPIRRMINFVGNTLVTSFWSRIDNPLNRRLVESIMDSAQIWLNGLTARGALVGGRIQFLEDDNPLTDLEDGIIRFHVSLMPPPPAREIVFIQELDVTYLSNLFGE